MKRRICLFLGLVFVFAMHANCQSQTVFGYPEILKSHPFYLRPTVLPSDSSLNGKIIDFKQFKDKILLVHFWSLTCAGCFRELPELNALAREFKDQGIVIISCMDESPTTLNKRIVSNESYYKLVRPVYGYDKIEFEIIPSAGGVRKALASKDIPSNAVPITYILKNGILLDLSYGYMMDVSNAEPTKTANYNHLRSKLVSLLDTKDD